MTSVYSEQVTINGAQLTVRERGAGEPVLFVHGSMGDECAAVVQEPVLIEQYRVIDYHRRGWGESEKLEAAISITQQAADAVAVLHHFGIPRAHLVGLSYGGVILLQAAVDYPSVVHSLALLEPALPAVLLTAPDFGAVAVEAGTLYGAGDKAGAIEVFGQAVIGEDFHTVCDKILPSGYFERWVADADTNFQFDMPALQAWSFTAEDAAKVTQPVLNMTGENTFSDFRTIYVTVKQWFPQAKSVVLADATHAMFQTNPAGSAEQLVAFFQSHPLRL